MPPDPPPLPRSIAVTGASGMVGTAFRKSLEARDRRVIRLVRGSPRGGDEVAWNPEEGRLDPNALARVDAVVHLAGEPIDSRWTAEKKRRIRESRERGTRLVAEAAARSGGPRVLVSASAFGYYGDRGDALLTEEASSGTGFLPGVVIAWEAATEPAEAAGIRVVRLRFGLILNRSGGLLDRILPIFRLGLGGTLGDGRQWMSWITIRDVVRLLETALGDDRYTGSFNAVSPEPVTNADFTRELGKALGRPTLITVPRFVLELAFGQMARETLLASTRAVPARLEKLGFRFEDPKLGPALRELVDR